MIDPVVIVVSPSRNPDGHKAYSNRGQLFDGAVDGRVIVTRTTQPFVDGCRTLATEGLDPTTPVVMRHHGQNYDALLSTIGAAAGMSVSDDNLGKPIFRRWQPRPIGENPLPGTPPVSEPRPAGASPHPDAPALSAAASQGSDA